MGSVRLYFAKDSPCDDNTQPYHTRLVTARVNKDRAFHRTPGRRCQVCYWCIIEDSRKRQHHHRHLEHKSTKSCRETSGTNTRNGQLQMEHLWTLGNEIEVLWKNNNEEGHKVFFSGKEDKHQQKGSIRVTKNLNRPKKKLTPSMPSYVGRG